MNQFKIIHTSDWHLGKKLFKVERIEEHILFLNWLRDYILNEKINLLIIAGDIFDIPTPSNQAQKAFHDFIFSLRNIPNFQTLIIPGNHDSPSLFEIPKDFFKENNAFIYPQLEKDLTKNNHYIETPFGTLGIKLLPYFRNFELINHINQGSFPDVESFFRHFFTNWDKEAQHKILISHHGFGQYSVAGSEHAIHLSGIDHFPTSWLERNFDYVALGHIHKRQVISQTPPAVYCGSPIPLRFGESNQKCIYEVGLSSQGITYQDKEVPNSKKLIQLKCSIEDLDSNLEKFKKKFQISKGYLEVQVTTDRPLAGVADKIRDELKDTGFELLSFIPKFQSSKTEIKSIDQISKTSLEDLFKDYYKTKYSEEIIPPTLLESFTDLLNEVRDED